MIKYFLYLSLILQVNFTFRYAFFKFHLRILSLLWIQTIIFETFYFKTDKIEDERSLKKSGSIKKVKNWSEENQRKTTPKEKCTTITNRSKKPTVIKFMFSLKPPLERAKKPRDFSHLKMWFVEKVLKIFLPMILTGSLSTFSVVNFPRKQPKTSTNKNMMMLKGK